MNGAYFSFSVFVKYYVNYVSNKNYTEDALKPVDYLNVFAVKYKYKCFNLDISLIKTIHILRDYKLSVLL